MQFAVIPLKAGILCFQADIDSGFRRNDGPWDFLRTYQQYNNTLYHFSVTLSR
jgi:hypothetical protein